MITSLVPGNSPEDQDSILKSLRVLTFFVTTTCNAKCETCFYADNLNDDKVALLSLQEIEQIARSMPKFSHLLFSGGEPVMRRELPEIASLFARHSGICSIDMPTNGLLPKRVVEVATRILDEHPDVLLTIGLSLDGLAETHDRLRGVPRNFDRSMETFDALDALRKERLALHRSGKGPDPRLRLITLTCVNNQNIDEVGALAEWITANKDVDGMSFEALRGEPKDKTLLPPTPDQFDRVVAMSMDINNRLFSRRFVEERARRLAYMRNVYRAQREHITTGKIPMTCLAGINLAVLEPDGRVRFCELLDEVGDLRATGFDFRKVWFSDEAVHQRRWIRESRCSCTHCVNLGHSIDGALKTRTQRQIDEFVLART